MNLKKGILIFLIGGILFVGAVNKKHMDKSIPAKEQAVLYVEYSSSVANINIDKAPGWITRFKNKAETFVLSPGEHTIYAQVVDTYGFSPFNPLPKEEFLVVSVPVTVKRDISSGIDSSPVVSFKYNFEAGRYYKIYRPNYPSTRPREGNIKSLSEEESSRIILVDNTDPSATWEIDVDYVKSETKTVDKIKKSIK